MDEMMLKMSEQNQIAQVMQENEYTGKFGMVLSQQKEGDFAGRTENGIWGKHFSEAYKGIL